MNALRDQLQGEIRQRQSHLNRSGDDLSKLRRELTDTLTFSTRDPLTLDPLLLDHEVQRLGEIHEQPVRLRSPTRRQVSPSIALRSMRAAAAVAASSATVSPLNTSSPSARARTSRPHY